MTSCFFNLKKKLALSFSMFMYVLYSRLDAYKVGGELNDVTDVVSGRMLTRRVCTYYRDYVYKIFVANFSTNISYHF